MVTVVVGFVFLLNEKEKLKSLFFSEDAAGKGAADDALKASSGTSPSSFFSSVEELVVETATGASAVLVVELVARVVITAVVVWVVVTSVLIGVGVGFLTTGLGGRGGGVSEEGVVVVRDEVVVVVLVTEESAARAE